MGTVMILSAGHRDHIFGLVDRRSMESRKRTGWLRDVLAAAALPGGTPPGRTRLEERRRSTS